MAKVMAGIDVEQLMKEFDDVSQFIYICNHSDSSHKSWLDFCKEKRNGRQDLEQLSKLMNSLSAPNPWRFVVDLETVRGLKALVDGITK